MIKIKSHYLQFRKMIEDKLCKIDDIVTPFFIMILK
jgi:hypothetical protein